MTHPSNSVGATSGSAFFGRAALFLRSVKRLTMTLKHRSEVRQLAEFDERMLKDIGLTRADVSGALDESVFHNPSHLLVRCVERRVRTQRLERSQRSAPSQAVVLKNAA